MTDRFAHLLSPIRIGNLDIHNRILFPAHCTHLCYTGAPSNDLIAYHIERARGGVGLIIMEGSRIHPTSQPDSKSLVAWYKENIPKYKALADAIHSHGSKVFQQLMHSGRATRSYHSGLPLWAPSPIRGSSKEIPHAMTKEEIKEVVEWWGRCAGYMREAGMDGVEIHGAHGYLIQEFLSPIANTRTDEYGGSLENRMRFGLEVLHAVRQAVGQDFAVGMRICADEIISGGLTLKETSKFAQALEATGEVDFLNVTLGADIEPGLSTYLADMSWPHNAFVHLAAGIKEAVRRTPIFAICRIVDVAEAEQVIADGKADMVGMVRANIADPEIGRKLKDNMDWDIRPCIGCSQGCLGAVLYPDKSISCLVNAAAGRELEWGLDTLTAASAPKGVLVVGGGLAGMEAARVAALRGHIVVLYEKENRLGGQVNTLVRAPHRQEFSNIVMWLGYQLKKLGVTVKLNTEATVERIKREAPDTIIIAAGSVPNLPNIPGAGEPGGTVVVSLDNALDRRVDIGKKVILLDDDGQYKAGSGAEFLADCGAEVHLVTNGETIGGRISPISRYPLLTRLKGKNVIFHRDTWCKEIRAKRVILYDVYNNREWELEDVDTIVAVVPNSPSNALYDTLKKKGIAKEVLAVGDCVAPRLALEAIREGHAAGRAI